MIVHICHVSLDRPGTYTLFCKFWKEEENNVSPKVSHPWLAMLLFVLAITSCPEGAETARDGSSSVVFAKRGDLLLRHWRPVVLPEERDDEPVCCT